MDNNVNSMDFIDRFFLRVIKIEESLHILDDFLDAHRKGLDVLFFSVMGVMVLFVKLGGKAGIIFSYFFIIIYGITCSVGWSRSVKKWIVASCFFNIIFSLIVSNLINGFVRLNSETGIFILVYTIIWVFVSLVSDPEISLVVNEIISLITGAVFTIGTYIMALLYQDYSSVDINDLYGFFHTNMIDDNFIRSFWGVVLLRNLFTLLLPIIGITALGISVIKAKMYWLKKNSRRFKIERYSKE